MKKYFLPLITGITLVLYSCGQHAKKVDEGQIKKNEYSSKEVGWTIEIPKNWTVTDLEKTKESTERGMKIIKEATDEEFDYSGLKNLITFQKDKFNIFQSSSEPFKLEYNGEWEENDHSLKILLYETYKNQGIKADSSETTIEKIDGLDFRTYSFTLYNPKGEPILTQVMYNRLINGLSFSVNINYNNENDRDVMLKAFKSSSFTHRR